MDGNGRWAQLRSRPRAFGHIKGTRVAKKIISTAAELEIENLTLYAFSTENWLRPEQEVDFLMQLLGRYLKKETETLVSKNIRFSVIGQLERLPSPILKVVKQTISATQGCTGMNLVFALSYGARAEISQAAKVIAQKVLNEELAIDDIDESLFNSYLSTYPAPDVDLIIRTSGEKRISNFLLWQSAYAEFYFSDTLWPSFTKNELMKILENYAARDRRFGKVSSKNDQPTA
jgi:undecaprenyl diphosphate synthase